MDLEYLVASAKAIRNLRLYQDQGMLDTIFAKLPRDMLRDVPATVLSEDIDDKYKNSLVSLHQAVKLAL